MKKLIFITAAFLFLMQLKAQVSVAVGSVTEAHSGTTLYIPLVVSGLDAATGGIPVTALEFHINYQISSVDYDTTLNFSPATNPLDWIFGASSLEYGTTWLQPSLLPISIPDGTVLFEVAFNYKGGQTILDLDSVRCIILDGDFNPVPVSQVTDGVITPASGSDQSIWNGIGNWNTAENWSAGVPGINTLALIETGSAEINSNASCKTLTINNTTSVIINSERTLTVDDGIINNGTFEIKSDSSGTGSVIASGVIGGSGTYISNLFMENGSGKPHLTGSPLESTSADIFSEMSPEKYNESLSQWQGFMTNDVLQKGYGLKLSPTSATTLSFIGQFNNTDLTLSDLSFTASAFTEFKGLNLICNPFPSAISADILSWSKSGMSNSVYVWDGKKYLVWNGKIGSLINGVVPAMQGFFVRSVNSGSSLTIPAQSRIHSSIPFYKQADELQNVLSIRFEKQENPDEYDETFIHVNSGSTVGYSSESDVVKLRAGNQLPEVCTQSSDGIKLAINTQPEFTSIPLEFNVPVSGIYNISVNGLNTFSSEIPMFLEDQQNSDNIFDLRFSPSFPFSFETPGNTGNRFVLHFNTIGINELNLNSLKTYFNEDHLHIEMKNNTQLEQVEIFSLTGSLLISFSKLTTPAVIPLNINCGRIAILRIRTSEGVFARKILLTD